MPKKKRQPALQTSDTEFRIQDRGFTFKIFQAYQLHSNIEKRRAQTTDNTFMCYPEKVRARRLHRSKDYHIVKGFGRLMQLAHRNVLNHGVRLAMWENGNVIYLATILNFKV